MASNAQLKTMLSSTKSLDTVSNTGTITFSALTTGGVKNYSIGVVVTKISGTVGGTLSVVYSNDGTNFFTYAGDSTITPANASGVYGWQLKDVAAPYIGVRYTGTGTMSASMRATYNPRK